MFSRTPKQQKEASSMKRLPVRAATPAAGAVWCAPRGRAVGRVLVVVVVVCRCDWLAAPFFAFEGAASSLPPASILAAQPVLAAAAPHHTQTRNAAAFLPSLPWGAAACSTARRVRRTRLRSGALKARRRLCGGLAFLLRTGVFLLVCDVQGMLCAARARARVSPAHTLLSARQV